MTLAVFLLSGVISGYFLKRSDAYVVDATVLNQPDVVEDDNSNVAARINVPILSEEESLIAAEIASAQNAGEEDLAVVLNEADSLESSLEPASQTGFEEVDVPVTGGPQTEASTAWSALFVAWQQITWNIFGAVVVALLMISLVRWNFWRSIR